MPNDAQREQIAPSSPANVDKLTKATTVPKLRTPDLKSMDGIGLSIKNIGKAVVRAVGIALLSGTLGHVSGEYARGEVHKRLETSEMLRDAPDKNKLLEPKNKNPENKNQMNALESIRNGLLESLGKPVTDKLNQTEAVRRINDAMDFYDKVQKYKKEGKEMVENGSYWLALLSVFNLSFKLLNLIFPKWEETPMKDNILKLREMFSGIQQFLSIVVSELTPEQVERIKDKCEKASPLIKNLVTWVSTKQAKSTINK